MKLGIIGSRTFEDYDLLINSIRDFSITEIVSGGAIGTEGYLTIPSISVDQDTDSFNYRGGVVKAKIFNKYLNDEDEVAMLSTYIFSLIKGI
jgi:hypothetical protein